MVHKVLISLAVASVAVISPTCATPLVEAEVYVKSKEILQSVVPLAQSRILSNLANKDCEDPVDNILNEAQEASKDFAIDHHNAEMYLVAKSLCEMEKHCISDLAKSMEKVFQLPDLEVLMRGIIGDDMDSFSEMLPQTEQLLPLLCMAFEQDAEAKLDELSREL